MKQINLYDLYKNINVKKERRNDVFNTILDKCHNIIISYSKKENYKCFYTVPEFVVGLPLYNIQECIQHIYKHLKKNGFLVNYYFPNILYISWDPNEIQREKNKNKMIQSNQQYEYQKQKQQQQQQQQNRYTHKNLSQHEMSANDMRKQHYQQYQQNIGNLPVPKQSGEFTGQYKKLSFND